MNRARKFPSRAGYTILFRPQLDPAKENLRKMGIPTPDESVDPRFFSLWTIAAVNQKQLQKFPRIFEQYPEAFCYVVLKIREAMRDTQWSVEPCKLAKVRPGVSKEEIGAALLYQMGEPHKQTKAEENAAAEMRRRADIETLRRAAKGRDGKSSLPEE